MKPPAISTATRQDQHSRFATRGIVGLSFAVLLLSGCASSSPAYHSVVMQGQVLSVEGNALTVCVGERDGAKVGQVLEVVRHVSKPSPPKATGPAFRREDVGTVRIVTLFDEHYASAVVVSGQPRPNDTVEFERR